MCAASGGVGIICPAPLVLSRREACGGGNGSTTPPPQAVPLWVSKGPIPWRGKTRFISLLLALVMSFSLITTAFAAENTDIPEDAITITDDDGNVIYLTDSEGNVIYWYNPETGETVWYNTDDNADNTQPADNADNTFVDEDLALVTSFSDVKRTAWYYNDVTECAKLGIVAGFENCQRQ